MPGELLQKMEMKIKKGILLDKTERALEDLQDDGRGAVPNAHIAIFTAAENEAFLHTTKARPQHKSLLHMPNVPAVT